MESDGVSKLLRKTHKEENRKSDVRGWLEYCGFDVDGEYDTGDGLVDLYLPNNRVLIEMKRVARRDNGPHAKGTGSRPDETAFEQLSRYVLAERDNERLYEQESMGRSWWLYFKGGHA